MYTIRTPAWLPRLYVRNGLWAGNRNNIKPTVYLTFDDGPHPEITHFVLQQLDRYDASATFFCIGQNAERQPGLTEILLRSRHSVGNHTHCHLNGRHTPADAYLADVARASTLLPTRLFRPPYGRIRCTQVDGLERSGYDLCMWSLLSADFDLAVTPQQCLQNVVFNIQPGDIVVFHDSVKAWPRLEYALPRVLEHCHRQRWRMEAIAEHSSE